MCICVCAGLGVTSKNLRVPSYSLVGFSNRNRTMCIVKIGADDILEHHGNFGGSVMYHDGETVYKTSTQGLTMTGSANVVSSW